MKNYIHLKAWSFAKESYVFVDTIHLFYRKLFLEKGIRTRKIREYHKPDSEIRIVECKVLKHDAQKLEELFPEIRKKALLLGYKDYDNICQSLSEIGERNGNISC